MEKKQYIKPSVKAYQITPTLIIAGSGTSQESFSNGGSGNPSGGRAREDAGRDVWSGTGNSVQW